MNAPISLASISLPDDVRRWLHEQASAAGLAEEAFLRRELIEAAKRHKDLKREIEIGAQALLRGEYKEYTDETLPKLAEEIKARGRTRLSKSKKKS